MSMEFAFAAVPFDHDGYLQELYDGNDLKEGVQRLKIVGEGSIPSPLGLSLNMAGVNNVDRETGGSFLKFTGGDENQRYILLAHRRPELAKLRAAIPNMSTEFRRDFLKALVESAESALAQHGEKASLLIY